MSGELRDEIVERVRRGEQLESIELELLSPRPGLNDEARAALWLYAWLECEAPHRRFGRSTPAPPLECGHD